MRARPVSNGVRLLLLGAGLRMAGAAVAVAALWAGFFWVTAPVGGS